MAEIVAPGSRVRVEVEKALFFFLQRAEELRQQRVFRQVGEIARVIMMPVVHAARTGTLTTTLRINVGAATAMPPRWAST